MDLLGDKIFAYTNLDKALIDIKNKSEQVQEKNVHYFYNGDKYLSDYVNSVMELRKSVSNFNNLFEDYMMELEQAELEIWEEEQSKIESEYYNGTEVYN